MRGYSHAPVTTFLSGPPPVTPSHQGALQQTWLPHKGSRSPNVYRAWPTSSQAANQTAPHSSQLATLRAPYTAQTTNQNLSQVNYPKPFDNNQMANHGQFYSRYPTNQPPLQTSNSAYGSGWTQKPSTEEAVSSHKNHPIWTIISSSHEKLPEHSANTYSRRENQNGSSNVQHSNTAVQTKSYRSSNYEHSGVSGHRPKSRKSGEVKSNESGRGMSHSTSYSRHLNDTRGFPSAQGRVLPQSMRSGDQSGGGTIRYSVGYRSRFPESAITGSHRSKESHRTNTTNSRLGGGLERQRTQVIEVRPKTKPATMSRVPATQPSPYFHADEFFTNKMQEIIFNSNLSHIPPPAPTRLLKHLFIGEVVKIV